MNNERTIEVTEIKIGNMIPEKIKNRDEYNCNYTIPQFQREFVWEEKDLIKLWDSIYRNYPIGSFMIWESSEKMEGFRNISDDIKLERTKDGYFKYILDGQQRITSLIVSILGGHKQKKNRKTPTDFRIYLYLKDVEVDKSDTNFENKQLNNNSFLFYTEKDLKKVLETELKYMVPISDLIKFNHEKVKEFYKTEPKYGELYLQLQKQFENYKLSLITLKNIPREEVCELFTRVNTQGKKLSTMDLITAYTYTDEFYIRGEDYFGKLYEDKLYNLNFDSIDELLIVRLISIIKKKSCSESDLFELTAQNYKELWAVASDSLIDAIEFLINKLNIQSPKILPYSPMLISLSYYMYLIRDKKLVFTDEIETKIKKWFWIKSFNGDYQGATNEEIKKDCKAFDDYLKGLSNFEYQLSKNVDKNKLLEEQLSLSSGFCKTILCVFANKRPRDFTNHQSINIYDVLIEYKKSELHHIFPKRSIVANNYSKDLINSIVNVCFLPKASNGSIGNDNPSKYFVQKVKMKNTQHYEEDLISNLILPIDQSGIWCDNFDLFLQQRTELIIKEIYAIVDYHAVAD